VRAVLALAFVRSGCLFVLVLATEHCLCSWFKVWGSGVFKRLHVLREICKSCASEGCARKINEEDDDGGCGAALLCGVQVNEPF
jgi:hypothetical protein